MLRNSFIAKALPLLSTLALTVTPGCDDAITFSNTPPGGLSITQNICYLAAGRAVVLTGQASDADGDPITFSWSADAGVFDPPDGGGRVVAWTAPASPGVYRVVLTASDGIDETTKGIDLTVGPMMPMDPGLIVLDQIDYPYFIDEETPRLIGARTTLRVGPGVTVIVNKSGGGLLIEGTMVVEGTAQERVTFKRNNCPGERGLWQGIAFRGDKASGTLHNMDIQLAEIGLKVELEASVEGAGLSITGCRDKAVAVVSAGCANLTASKIWENAHGVFVENGALDISGSSVRYNGNYGFYFISSAYDGYFEVSVSDCVVATNNGDGLRLSQHADPVINGNSLFYNQTQAGTGFALILIAYSGDRTIDARGNFWGVVTEEEVAGEIFRGAAAAEVDYSGWLASPPVSD